MNKCIVVSILILFLFLNFINFILITSWHQKKIKVAVISSIFGNYDKFRDYKIKNMNEFDWYLFTDDYRITLKSILRMSIRRVINAKYHLENRKEYSKYKNYFLNIKDENVRNMMAAKYYKVQSHRIGFLKKYDYFIWLDGSIRLKENFVSNVLELINNNYELINFKHSARANVKDELEFSIFFQKYKNQNLTHQYESYKLFPDNMGLYENGLFIRKNTNKINKLFNDWWVEILKFSYQDQISYPFVLWKNNITPDYIINDNVFNNSKYCFVVHNNNH